MIKNKVDTKDFLKLEDLKIFQWDFKKQNNDDEISDLASAILRDWFSCPISVRNDWKNNFILDWHQRLKALKKLAEANHFLDDNLIPIISIKANNKKDAKKILLANNTTYSTIDWKEYTLFVEEFKIWELDHINISDFKPVDYSMEDVIKIEESHTWKWLNFPEQQRFRDKEEEWQINNWEDLNKYSEQQENVEWENDILSELDKIELPETNQNVIRWLQVPVKQENYDETWKEFKIAINNWVDVWLLLLNSLKNENNRD